MDDVQTDVGETLAEKHRDYVHHRDQAISLLNVRSAEAREAAHPLPDAVELPHGKAGGEERARAKAPSRKAKRAPKTQGKKQKAKSRRTKRKKKTRPARSSSIPVSREGFTPGQLKILEAIVERRAFTEAGAVTGGTLVESGTVGSIASLDSQWSLLRGKMKEKGKPEILPTASGETGLFHSTRPIRLSN